MNGYKLSFNPHVESLVYKKIGSNVALLFKGRVMALRKPSDKTGRKQLENIANAIMDKFLKANGKAIARGQLIMNIKGEENLDKWFK